MALKGTTKIQMFDAKSGKLTDEIVKENMITNAVPNILNPSLQMLMGESADSYGGHTTRIIEFMKRCSPIGKYLFGGVLLFSDPLDEHVDNIIPSVADRNKIVGHAGQFSSITGNVKKGSYNATESIELEDGYTHVWDFTSEQANGDIACIALTSAMGGDCGWETVADATNRGNFLIPIVSADFTAQTKVASSSDFKWGSSTAFAFKNVKFGDDTIRYCNEVVTNGEYTALFGLSFNQSGGGAHVNWAVRKFACDINLNQKITNNEFDNIHAVQATGLWSSELAYNDKAVDTTRVDAYAFDNVYRFVFRSNSERTLWGKSGTDPAILMWKDFTLNDDGTITEGDMHTLSINTQDILTVFNAFTGGTYTDVSFSSDTRSMYIDDKYAYFAGTRYNNYYQDFRAYILRVSIENATDITVLNKPNWLGTTSYTARRFLGEALITSDNNTLEAYRTSDFINFYRLDNGWNTQYISDRLASCIKYPFVLLEETGQGLNTDAKTARVMLLAPYMATINNLEKTYTKTPDKTMKITYTIQNI